MFFCLGVLGFFCYEGSVNSGDGGDGCVYISTDGGCSDGGVSRDSSGGRIPKPSK